jgi:hypothetical protein
MNFGFLRWNWEVPVPVNSALNVRLRERRQSASSRVHPLAPEPVGRSTLYCLMPALAGVFICARPSLPILADSKSDLHRARREDPQNPRNNV